jgi:hypothetical protein
LLFSICKSLGLVKVDYVHISDEEIEKELEEIRKELENIQVGVPKKQVTIIRSKKARQAKVMTQSVPKNIQGAYPLKIIGYEARSLFDIMCKAKKVPIIDPTSVVVAVHSDGKPCFERRNKPYNQETLSRIKKCTKAEWALVQKEANEYLENKRIEDNHQRDEQHKFDEDKGRITRRAIVWFDKGCDSNYCCRSGDTCSPNNAWLIPLIENLVMQFRYDEVALKRAVNHL